MAFGPTQHQKHDAAKAVSPTIKAVWSSDPASPLKADAGMGSDPASLLKADAGMVSEPAGVNILLVAVDHLHTWLPGQLVSAPHTQQSSKFKLSGIDNGSL